jgi:hypothetical protein
VAFSKDPKVLDQYFRNQYVEFNTPKNVEVESDALAILLDELYQERGRGAILHTHSSSHSRGLLVPRKTNTLAGQIGWEPSVFPVFPMGELPPPIPRADGVLVPSGAEIPLEEFKKLTRHPILLIWGDFIPKALDPANAGTAPETRRIWVEAYKRFATVAAKYGGNVKNVVLPGRWRVRKYAPPDGGYEQCGGISRSIRLAEGGKPGQVKVSAVQINAAV